MTENGSPRIPFNKPSFAGSEERYIAEAIANAHISGDGPFTARCSRILETAIGASRVLLTTNCTHALEMTALLLGLGPGDEVIVPAFTFVSTANAYVLRGAKPVFIDIRPDTLNIDERAIEAAITPKTKAIVVVHYAGVACEMDAIMELSRRRDIPVIEDNAHGLFAQYRGRQLGSFGALATQSFHETKNFSCGEGGALVINADAFIEPAEIIREKGTNRARFFRGQIDKYTWVDAGSSYLPSDLLAAVLFGQLEKRDEIQTRRKAIWERYNDYLSGWASENGIRLPVVPAHCDQAYHMFYLLMPSLADRTRFIERLRRDSIFAVFHYLPLNASPEARALGAQTECPVTEDISDRLVRLPFYNSLTDIEQERVIEAIHRFQIAGV